MGILVFVLWVEKGKISHGNRSFDSKAKGHILMDEVGNYPQKD